MTFDKKGDEKDDSTGIEASAQEHTHSLCHGGHDHETVMKNLQAVRAVVDMLEASQLCELEYVCGDFSVRAVKARSGAAPLVTVSESAHSMVQRNDAGAPQDPQPLGQDYVKSPMVGTVYLAPKPGDPHFITQGCMVQEGQSILIIEAMKTMNVIKAPKSGRVHKIFVQNGSPVEFGQPLVHIQ